REMVDDAALRLASFAVRPQDRVAMVFPSGPEAIVMFLAAASVATACPMNSAYKEAEFRFYLEDTGARFLLAPAGDGADARRALPEGSTVIEADIDDSGRLRLESKGPHPALPRERGMEIEGCETKDSEEIALVLQTSGRTSRPTRLPLRHSNLTESVATISLTYRICPELV